MVNYQHHMPLEGVLACILIGMSASFLVGIGAWIYAGPYAGALVTSAAFGFGAVLTAVCRTNRDQIITEALSRAAMFAIHNRDATKQQWRDFVDIQINHRYNYRISNDKELPK